MDLLRRQEGTAQKMAKFTLTEQGAIHDYGSDYLKTEAEDCNTLAV
jgi:hypothetical protein